MKSLSRYGRNTLDVLLMLLDELSKLNVVYFETEDIRLDDTQVKKYIIIAMAAYQEESRQKSEAIKSGVFIRTVSTTHVNLYKSLFLSYSRDNNDSLMIFEEEARIVWLIYDLFL
jgi:site-specific DNA recombinase